MPGISRPFSRSQSSRMHGFYFPHQVNSTLHACQSTHADTSRRSKKQTHLSLKYCTNSIITMLITVPAFLPVNHMNYNCFMNILRVKGAHSELRRSLPLFQGQVTPPTAPAQATRPPARPPTPTTTNTTCFLFSLLIQHANRSPVEQLKGERVTNTHTVNE